MNKQNRKELQDYIEQLDEIKSGLESMQDCEQEKIDNMPENLQESMLAVSMQDAIDTLEGAVSSLEEAIDYLNETLGY